MERSSYNIYKYTKIDRQKPNIYLKHPQFKMAGIALKARETFCHNGPSRRVFERKMFEEKKNFISKVNRNAAFQGC